MLVGHGRLYGYAEGSSDRELRGARLLCSRRHRRMGCGRTFGILLASVVPRRVVRASTIFGFFVALSGGAAVAQAWRGVSAMSLRTGYRIRSRLALAGSAIRTALCSRAPPPAIASASPDKQLLAHLRVVLGPTDSFSAYQLTFQRALLR